MANEKRRLIDANALIEDVKAAEANAGMGSIVGSTIIRYVKRCDTVDAVEVVRCKDCKHYEDHRRKVYENCVRDGRQRPMLPNDFCSYGERKDNERKAD